MHNSIDIDNQIRREYAGTNNSHHEIENRRLDENLKTNTH